MIKAVLMIVMFLSFLPMSLAVEPSASFAPSFNNHGQQLTLKGTGFKRVLFMKAFRVAFYSDDEMTAENVLSDIPKRLEVLYFVSIPAEKLSDYTESLMKANLTKEEFGALKEEMPLMREYFVDLRPGDRYALTYIPDVGTEFEHNGKLVGIIKGELFAKAIFSTWLGGKPMDKHIKRLILGLTESSTIPAVDEG